MNNKIVKYPLILGTIALVAGLLLALVYNITAPIIEENKIKRENSIIIEIFGEDAKVEDISNTLTNLETSKGIYSVLKVTDSGNKYYVYKVNTEDNYDKGVNSYVVAIDNSGFIYKFKMVSYADNFGEYYASDDYADSVKGKNTLTEDDIVSRATKSGEPIVESINVAIAHQGRVK